jgi:hypothetical protein
VRFFFYGTLIDPDVRRIVLGELAPAEVERAMLSGWERVKVRNATFPMIRRRAGARVEGVLARGLDAEARRRLVAYEDESAYDVFEVAVALASGKRLGAWVFAPPPGGALAAGRGAWRFDDWERRHKRDFLRSIGREGPRD